MNTVIFILLIVWVLILSNKIRTLYKRTEQLKDHIADVSKSGNRHFKAFEELCVKCGYVLVKDWVVKHSCGQPKAVEVLKIEDSVETKARNHFMEAHVLPELEKMVDHFAPENKEVVVKKKSLKK